MSNNSTLKNFNNNSSQQKRQKIPKRGPGIAELEKILREQKGIFTEISEEISDENQYNLANFSSTNSYRESSLSLPYCETIGMRNHLYSPSKKKMVSMIPPSNFRVLSAFSDCNRPHQSSINDSSSFNSIEECDRYAKWDRTLELGNNYNVAVHDQLPLLNLFPCVLSKGNVHPVKVIEDKINSYQCSESSEPSRVTFYNFLEVKDLEGVTDSTNPGLCETVKVGIDLNLKL
ncbi:unnamed protein product [Sphenostylis stenocarpa]|uniref:Uncharacterized protein n=1 Tax=Sphenostylis stenocarpa TaxID=92480 RepID=A0AA86SZB2_9FABA|nr:unnamed protein product [Sphenostylis stenocarpa]